MFRYHIKFAIRNFLRNKTFSLINILGLSVGIASALLILLWVRHEYSVNRFHAKRKVLYRIICDQEYSDGTDFIAPETPSMLGRTLLAEIPEIKNQNTRTPTYPLLVKNDTMGFKENVMVADPSLFEMFTFPMVTGSYEPMKHDIYSVVISQKLSKEFFPDGNALGQSLNIVAMDLNINVKIAGIFKDFPENSTLQTDLVLPFEFLIQEDEGTKSWGNFGYLTSIELYPGSDIEAVNKKMTDILNREHHFRKDKLFLQLFSDSYLKSAFIDYKTATGKIVFVRIFILIALFTLIIACINFMNLSTARAAKRMREIGVKKVIGVHRPTLIGQFMGESVLMAFISTILAFIITELVLPVFNSQLGYHLVIPYQDPLFLLILAGICLFTGLFSGSYPALVLSSLRPMQVIKGSLKSGRSRLRSREVLVVFQFALSIFLITGTLIMFRQIRFIMNRDIGLDRENVLKVPVYQNIMDHHKAFKNEILSERNILGAAYSDETPFSVGSYTDDPQWSGKSPDTHISFGIINADKDFVPTMGMTIIEGKNFSGNPLTDKSSFIVNEKAVDAMGLKDPVGASLSFWGIDGHIRGVVKNFINQNMHTSIKPLIIRCYVMRNEDLNLFIRLKNRNIEEALQYLGRLYKKYEPAYPFQYTFLDETFQRQYRTETLVGKLSVLFAGLSIFIACLGLLGLSAYMAEQRTREIGIRKTFGASASNMVLLLSGNFTKLVLISFILSIPGVYYLMRIYLDSYAYRIHMNFLYFAAGGIIALIIAWLTVSYQSFRAAGKNPVEILRYE